MKKTYGQWLSLMVGTLLLVILSACNTPSATQAPKSQAPKSANQVLLDSFTTMKQLKTVHVDLHGTTEVTTSSGTATTQGTTVNVNLSGNGDEILPDQASMHLVMSMNLGATTTSFNMAEIVKDKQLYMQNQKGKWYQLDSSALGASGSMNPFAGTNLSSYTQLLDVAQKAKIADHGNQSLGGQSLRHISVLFGKDALKDLLEASGQAGSFSTSQQALLDKITLDKPTLDLWIDPSNSYIHSLELKYTMNMDLKGATTATSTTPSASPSAMAMGIDMAVNYSKFNEAVKITVPTDAVPASNMMQLFQ